MTETSKEARYYIDMEGASALGRSLSMLITDRRCYQCRQASTEESTEAYDLKDLIAQITQHCADTSDYLLPDTPLKESIFRVILAGGNEPMAAEEISEYLSTRWAMSAYPRDLSPKVINRILENSERYCIAAYPEPIVEEGGEDSGPPVEPDSDAAEQTI